MTAFKNFCDQLTMLDIILVSGPQRSGTRFITYAIADELEYEPIEEGQFHCDNIEEFEKLINSKRKIVVHCPAMCHTLEDYSKENIAAVFVMREDKKIIASQKRVSWDAEEKERAKYIKNFNLTESIKNQEICKIKKHVWKSIQIPNIQNNFTLDYNLAKESKLYLPDKERKNFKIYQVK